MGFDSKTEVLVRGVGFTPIANVREGTQIACMCPDSLQFEWGYPCGLSKEDVGEVCVMDGPNTSVVCSVTQPILTYCGGETWKCSTDLSFAQVLHGCEWGGLDSDTFKFGTHTLETAPFLTIIAAYLKGGELGEDRITLIDVDEKVMESVRQTGLDFEIIGDYLDIKLPNVLRWFFRLFGEGDDERIFTKLKRLKTEYLPLLWRPFVDCVVKNRRLLSDLVEIVIKSGYTPKVVSNRLFVENRMASKCEIDLEERDTTLYDLDVKSGAVLIERNGNFTWIYTR